MTIRKRHIIIVFPYLAVHLRSLQHDGSISLSDKSLLSNELFVFEGFLPKKPGKKKKLLKTLQKESRTIIIYESPYRLLKTLETIKGIMGERRIAVCREMTKKFEEIIRGTVTEVLDKFKNRKILGEVVIIIDGRRNKSPGISAGEG